MHATSPFGLIASLATVLLLIIVIGRLAGRFGLPVLSSGGRQTRLGIGATLAIDPKRRLVVLTCDGRDCLLLLGPSGDTMLGWLERPAETRR